MSNNKAVSAQTKASEAMMVFVAIVWGLTFVAGAWAMPTEFASNGAPVNGFPAEWILLIRFAIASISLSLLFYDQWSKANKFTWLAGLSYGVMFAIGLYVQMVGLQYTTPAKQSFLLVSYVLFVPMFQFFFWKIVPPMGKFVPSAIMLVVGVGLISLQGGELDLTIGDGMTIIYALIFALQIVIMGRIAPRLESIQIFTIIQFISATIVYIIILLVRSGAPSAQMPDLNDISGQAWMGFIFLVIFNSMVAFMVQNVAQRYARPTNAALIISTESIFGAFAAYFLAGEEFNLQKIIGCILVFVGIMFYQADFGALLKKKEA